MRLRAGDRVKIITGKDLGRESRISRVIPGRNKVIVEGVNTAKRHQRPQSGTMQGGIIDKDRPIDASNVMIICEECGPTRIGKRFDERGKRRVCRRCGGDL